MRITSLSVFLFGLMLIARLIAEFMTPTVATSLFAEEVDLEEVFPRDFGEWSIDPSIRIIQPTEEGSLADKVYNQTVARGYRNLDGDLVMFVAAYGKRQNDTLQLHLPEVCYVANGFRILDNRQAAINVGGENSVFINARQLMTASSYRKEPVTYWTRIGDSIPSGTLERQYAKLSYGLSGRIPDGLLVRVSNVSSDKEASFGLHEAFIQEMVGHMKKADLGMMLGGAGKTWSPRVSSVSGQ